MFSCMKTLFPATLALALVAIGTSVFAAPPSVTCSPSSTVLCGSSATLTAEVLEPDAQALTVVWTVNGANVYTNDLPALNPPTPQQVSFAADLPFGTNQVSTTATDPDGNSASCDTVVVVQDVTPPVITSVSVDRTVLWPPNHRLTQIAVRADVADDCTATSWKIISVSSNESETARGSGHTPSDWQINGDHKVKLRAERSGNGSGRIYTITVQAWDAAGNPSNLKTVTVSVPHDKGKGKGGASGDSSKGNGNGTGNGKGKGKGK
jgi:hypothetical protein